MTTTTTSLPPSPSSRPPGPRARPAGPGVVPRRNPWGHPWFLEGFTWLYLIWSLVPIGLAVLFSFNNGKSQAVWQGFSWRWYFTDPVNSVLHNPALSTAVLVTLRLSFYTTLIAVPLGVAFALGINRWRGVTAASFNFVMILSFVIPELIFGVAMFFVFTIAVHLRAPGHAGRDAGPGHLERELARDHRAGQAGDDGETVRGGRGRPGRQPVADDTPGAHRRC